MKSQAFFFSKDKSKKLKCRLLQFLFGTLRVKMPNRYNLRSWESHLDLNFVFLPTIIFSSSLSVAFTAFEIIVLI